MYMYIYIYIFKGTPSKKKERNRKYHTQISFSTSRLQVPRSPNSPRRQFLKMALGGSDTAVVTEAKGSRFAKGTLAPKQGRLGSPFVSFGFALFWCWLVLVAGL